MTAAEIASATGVSASTVSKVLHGRGDVAAGTRERVQAAIEASGYRLRVARAAPATPLIHLVFDHYGAEWATEIVRGAARAALSEGLAVALTALPGGEGAGRWPGALLALKSRGVILLLPRLEPELRRYLHELNVPYVAVDPRGERDPEVVTVGASNWPGGLAATRHLLELGHRRVGVIGGHRDMLASRARVDGHRAALEMHGLPADPRLVRWGDFTVAGGFREAEALLGLAERPTAIFAGNDLQALGVLEAARRQGLSVPGELSVVGFDDLAFSRWTSPPLTTVHQPLARMAGTAVRLLVAMGRGEPPPHRSLELATSLVVRESTAPPR